MRVACAGLSKIVHGVNFFKHVLNLDVALRSPTYDRTYVGVYAAFAGADRSHTKSPRTETPMRSNGPRKPVFGPLLLSL